MPFWKKKRKQRNQPQRILEEENTPKKQRRRAFPIEVKLLAAKACVAGLASSEVAELVHCGPSTVSAWFRAYREGGPEALVRKNATVATRRVCTKIERLIQQHRQENPEDGVRRIRDELRRNQNLEVSAEKVRQVVNQAGLGNPPPEPTRQPPQVRRFERELPNAMWQIDIFTFNLKRMYPVYLVGIIDDHSRYMVGYGLFRQQTADAVLEVVKGAVGEWGAPREILSDNGRQFAAWRGKTRFQKVLKREGIQHVRSAPHHPKTLGKIERFWQTIWREFLEEALFASFADAAQRIGHWISYYNHQRPHQGIDGACPSDRFYGLENDMKEAIRHGCKENALRLALGQETKPPLYLLGKLGETDVRVCRKGDDIEVKLGDTIHEVIRAGAPFAVAENGTLCRKEAANAVEGPGRRREVPDCGDGEEGRGVGEGDLQDLRGNPASFEPGGGEGRSGCGGSLGAQEERQETEDDGGVGSVRARPKKIFVRERIGALEDEVRDSQDVYRVGEEVGSGGDTAWREAVGEKKAGASQEEQEEIAGYERLWLQRGDAGDGSET
jgi:transposase InsO family protein